MCVTSELKNLHLKQVSSQKHLTSVKERVKNAVMSRFKDIIHEVKSMLVSIIHISAYFESYVRVYAWFKVLNFK